MHKYSVRSIFARRNAQLRSKGKLYAVTDLVPLGRTHAEHVARRVESRTKAQGLRVAANKRRRVRRWIKNHIAELGREESWRVSKQKARQRARGGRIA